ncbi:hypothetical protein [Bacilliculturomica massiliensis]|uniref:hypothetical protein n=1 Tax=Bacilliculturomica massiliensis TaxID=1917867 RepID=UPI0010325485|nr:hypothetical protein [Bacilliculturomica massiliensis]
MWIEILELVNAGELLSQALEEGAAYIPGASFFAGCESRDAAGLNFTAVAPQEITEGIRRPANVLCRAAASRKPVGSQ